MMDTEHTPLPWARHPHNNRICHVTDHGSFDVVSDDPRIGDADAALIVHSVNLLPDLVEALREARVYVHLYVQDDGGIDNCEIGDRLALERIEALLAKATS
jgi:hypothetical protein